MSFKISNCKVCGNEFSAVKNGECGRWPHFCGPECKKKFTRDVYAPRVRAKIKAKKAANGTHWSIGKKLKRHTCVICGKEFTSFQSKVATCSLECLAKRLKDCAVKGCAASAKNRRKFATKADRHRFWYYRRRISLALAVKAEKFSAQEIFDRDKWICRICGFGVDKKLKWPHRYAATMDHIIPVKAGGEHTKANAQCAHFICNMRKGKKWREEALGQVQAAQRAASKA